MLALSLNSSLTHADNLTWDQLKTDKVQILEHSSDQGEVMTSYIPYVLDIGRALFELDPKKEPKNTSDPIYQEPRSVFGELMGNLFVKIDLSGTAHFRKVWFKPKTDLQFRGLFAIHDFEKKRPFVILRMGVHGNVDELFAERYLLRALYDDLDLNVLVLESLTSHAFLTTNKEIAMGGVDEGLQTFFVLNELKNSKLNDVIASYHLVALSMGGAGTFVTALLDQSNQHIIKSVANFCPLINMQETIEAQSGEGFKATLVDLWNVQRLNSIFDHFPDRPELKDWWKSIFDFKPRFTKAALKLINESRKTPLFTVEDMNGLIKDMKWPKGLQEKLSKPSSLFEYNNFWPLYQGVTTPVMIYTTPKDPLVINMLNSERIFRGTQPGDFKSLKYTRLQKSVHCGLASVYSWDYIVKMMHEGLEL